MDIIEIYTDGGCRGNQKKENIGGYGAVLIYKDNIKELKYATKNTTNNRMELLSVVDALKFVKANINGIKLYSDSQYVISTLNNGWKKNANKDLWAELEEQQKRLSNNPIEFIKVKGHSDNVGNSRADELANIAMDNYVDDVF